MGLPFFMPMRNERLAPKFDTSRPRELPRFFEDFEELVFRAQISDEAEKKKFLVRYTDFKAAILFYYPEASDNFAYSFRDLELLIREYQRLGIATVPNLCEYHRR